MSDDHRMVLEWLTSPEENAQLEVFRKKIVNKFEIRGYSSIELPIERLDDDTSLVFGRQGIKLGVLNKLGVQIPVYVLITSMTRNQIIQPGVVPIRFIQFKNVFKILNSKLPGMIIMLGDYSSAQDINPFQGKVIHDMNQIKNMPNHLHTFAYAGNERSRIADLGATVAGSFLFGISLLDNSKWMNIAETIENWAVRQNIVLQKA